MAMTDERLRDILADELKKNGVENLALSVRAGIDTSHGGTAAFAAMRRARTETIDAILQICRDTDTLGRAEADILDYRTHVTGEI